MLPMNFEPDKGSGGKYVLNKLESGGKIKIRMLSDFITGRCVWGDGPDGKRAVYRVKPGEPIPASKIGVSKFSGKPERIKQFIAAIAYNYESKQVEIFECDKAKLVSQIFALEASEDWGDSREYDITLSKTGTGTDTTYSALPSNKAPMKEKVDFSKVNLEALYTPNGGDPFNPIDVEEKVEDQIVDSEESDEVASDVPF